MKVEQVPVQVVLEHAVLLAADVEGVTSNSHQLEVTTNATALEGFLERYV